MGTTMFCRQCEEAADGVGCTAGGRCGKPAAVANKMDELIAKLVDLSVKLAGRSDVTREYSRFLCRALYSTLTNVNFNENRIQSLIDEAKRAIRALGGDPDASWTKSEDDETTRSKRELLLYGLKGISAYAFHALALGYEDNTVYDFILRALLSMSKPLAPSELDALLLDCGSVAAVTMALLDNAHSDTFGEPRMGTVPTGVGSNPGILISGHDMKDLEELLIQTEGTGIDVYTHGEMLPAHYYPKLRKYKHLVGNYGSSWWKQGDEFESFHGPILLTGNCLVPVRAAYKDRIFTTGMAGYPDVPHIVHRHIGGQKDFSALIEAARKCAPPVALENGTLTGGFSHEQVCAVADQIASHIRNGKIRRFVVMAGCDGRSEKRSYFTELAESLPQDMVILTAGCAKYRFNKQDLGEINGIPRVLDAGQCNDSYSLVRIALKLRALLQLREMSDLPISFVLAWYEQKAVAVLLALLALGFRNIRLGPSLPAFLSADVVEELVRKFGIMPIGDAAADAKAIAEGK